MKLFLDDERSPTFVGWVDDCEVVIARDATLAIRWLAKGVITHVSLDHDLGEFSHAGSGYDVACWIERAAHDGTLDRVVCQCHSMNPVGRDRINAALAGARKAWDARDEHTP
jgi:hypothetical protein